MLLRLFLLTIGLIVFTFNANAQQQDTAAEQDLVITIGDTITFTNLCDSGTYKHVDMYVKTRYIDTVLTFNPITGEGFYKTFFAEGDFDAKRMPCSYAGKKFTITATQYFKDKRTGADRFVVFVLLENWRTVAWIEFIDAYSAGEVKLN